MEKNRNSGSARALLAIALLLAILWVAYGAFLAGWWG
jgi:CHASE2 domain-containing sensor protein